MFNLVLLQTKYFSPLVVFKKLYVHDFRDCYERVPDIEIKQKWNQLSLIEREPFKIWSEAWI